MKKQHKKAQIEVLFIIVILFCFALVIFIGHKFINELNDAIQNDGDSTAEAKAASQDATARYPSIFDAGFITFFILVWVAILVSAWFIDTNPMFFIASILVFGFTLIVAFGLNEAYTEFITDADFITVSSTFPMINFIIGNLGLITAAIAFSVIIVLYGKSRLSQNAY